MKYLLITSMSIFLISCASTKREKELSEKSSNPNPITIQEETIASRIKPEVRKVTIARPGIDSNKILNGAADLFVDGELESDSLKKRNAVEVIIDDAVEETAEIEAPSNKVKTPQ